MYTVVEETKKLSVIDYFIAFFWELFPVIELLKEVSNDVGGFQRVVMWSKVSVKSEEVMVPYSV